MRRAPVVMMVNTSAQHRSTSCAIIPNMVSIKNLGNNYCLLLVQFKVFCISGLSRPLWHLETFFPFLAGLFSFENAFTQNKRVKLNSTYWSFSSVCNCDVPTKRMFPFFREVICHVNGSMVYIIQSKWRKL